MYSLNLLPIRDLSLGGVLLHILQPLKVRHYLIKLFPNYLDLHLCHHSPHSKLWDDP